MNKIINNYFTHTDTPTLQNFTGGGVGYKPILNKEFVKNNKLKVQLKT